MGNKVLHEGNYNNYALPLAGGAMTGSPVITFPASAGSLSASTPMSITYGRIASYGTLCINANTDNSGTEYVILTAGNGLSSDINAGLAVGSNTLTWLGSPIMTAANFTGSMDGRYVKKSGDSMSGTLSITPAYQATPASRYHSAALEIREAGGVTSAQSDIGYAPRIGFHWGGRVAASLAFHSNGAFYFRNQADTGQAPVYASAVYGAVWNDYAEYRKAETLEAGRVVIEDKSGKMKLSTERLQPGANVVSDTFGFAIGETDDCKTPLAVAGRVLAYPYEDRDSYPLGAAVCSGPNGTISLMTREEIREYPERIIGTVSEIPTYEVWGDGNAPVNGRIWIKVR
jgi:hypothetical protein